MMEIPKGTIFIFRGKTEEIPEGWQLCDGTNGTPDLREARITAVNPSGAEFLAVGYFTRYIQRK